MNRYVYSVMKYFMIKKPIREVENSKCATQKCTDMNVLIKNICKIGY